MKKYPGIILITLLSTVIIISCKKGDDKKKYTALIKNKTYWGQLTNAGETPQPYSIYFKEDGSLIWSQRNGDYAGKWIINNNQVTMDFLVPAVQIKADISDDNILTNIVANNSSIVGTGYLIAKPAITLDNTVWKGVITQSSTLQVLQLNFMSGSKVEGKVGSSSIGSTYTRSQSGAVLNFTLGSFPFFAIITSDKEMTGQWNFYGTYYQWQATKQ